MAKLEPRNIQFFSSPGEFNSWLKEHHAQEDALWVGFYKKHTGKPSMTWSDSVDEALCFGWIDGIRKSLGDEAYTIRFTPRRPGSIWSAVNIEKMAKLISEGRMTQAGLDAFRKKQVKRSKIYSYERENAKLVKEYLDEFKNDKSAFKFFKSQPPSYRKPAIWWVMSAKREETRRRRLKQLIVDSANGERIKQLRRP